MTGDVYIADRSNAAVDIFSGASLSLIGRATGFTGQQATTSVSGPDGVVTVTSGGVTTLYAGDGNSTLRVYSGTNPASPSFVTAISTNPMNTPPVTRVDEMAYSPLTGQVLAANNAATPAFGNLFSTTSGHPPVSLSISPITVPAGQGGINAGGMEQPAWNPTTNTFFVSIPALAGTNNPGGVSEINTSGTVLHTFDFGTMGITSCSPAGLAVGASGNMLVGCGNVGTQAILLSPTGTIIKTISGLGGTDELWYDPTTNAFYVTGNDGSNSTRFFDVIGDDGMGTVTRVDLPDTTSAHSIAVDPFNGDVFVALAGTATVDGTPGIDPCPASFANPGCIAVFVPVPEPESLSILAVGLVGLIGFAVRLRAVR